MKSEEIIIDATNSVVGRIASFAAKQALLGNRVTIVNSDKAIITGNKNSIIEDFRAKRRRGGVKGPFQPSKPAAIIKRAIRGMVPNKKARGLNALKNIRCFDGIPNEYSNAKKLSISVKKTVKSLGISELG